MKFLLEAHIKEKLILLRSDLNSDVEKEKVLMGPRIKEAATTIQALKKKGAKIVVIAHQGNKGKKDYLSLKQHAKLLNKITKITFVEDLCGEKAKKEIQKLRPGKAILLENLRFEEAETNNHTKENTILEELVPQFDLYINDAFSVCHRRHTSIVQVPKKLPSYAGPLIQKELEALNKLKLKNALFILGGGKPETNIQLLGKKGTTVIGVGYFGQTILLARGIDLGYQTEYLQKDALIKGGWTKLLNTLKQKAKKVITPIDFAVNIEGKRKEKVLRQFPVPYQIDDIGTGSIELFKRDIEKATAIYMKGPAGYATNPKFAKGTIALLREIAKSNAYSIVGGGHLSEAIEKYRLPKSKFNHVSLSGGALLEYISGKKLPGLIALDQSEKKFKKKKK